MDKKITILLLFLILFLFNSVSFAINLDLESQSALLMEASTGEIIYENNSHQKLPPASITKIMTMLLTMEALEQEKINLSDVAVISERAASMGGSQIWLEVGEEMTVEDLLKAVAIVSANDASVALAEYVAGSEKRFINLMNQKAKELGLENTFFYNTNGLPVDKSKGEGNYTTAYDIAVMARELLKYNKIIEYSSTWIDYLRDGESFLRNTNDLVSSYQGADGIKTGFTNESGFCVAATAKRDGMRFIVVIMDAPNSKIRFQEAEELLSYAFNSYEPITISEQGEEIEELNVLQGKKQKVTGVAKNDLVIPIVKGESKKIKKEINFFKLTVPIQKGEEIGEILIKKEGKVISKTKIIAKDEVQKANVLIMMLHLLKRYLENIILN